MGGGGCACMRVWLCVCVLAGRRNEKQNKSNAWKRTAENKLRQPNGWRGEACHLEALPGGWGNA